MLKRLNVVTGACGFVGSHLVKLLLENNQQVIATDLPKAFLHPKNQMIFKSLGIDFSHPNCQVIPADLTDIESISKVFEQPVTHFFHTASLYDYSASFTLGLLVDFISMGKTLFVKYEKISCAIRE